MRRKIGCAGTALLAGGVVVGLILPATQLDPWPSKLVVFGMFGLGIVLCCAWLWLPSSP